MVVTNMCPFPKFYGYIVVHFENILILRNCTIRNLAVRRHQILSFFSPVQEKKKASFCAILDIRKTNKKDYILCGIMEEASMSF